MVVFPISQNITSEELVCEYRDRVWRMHGTPLSILSDRGPQFISAFTRNLQRALGIMTRLAAAHHPQTDGQTERTQQTWEQYLRAYATEANWPAFIPAMEFAYNSMVHSTTGAPPFHISCTYRPRIGFEPVPAGASQWAADCWERIEEAKRRLIRVRDQMAQQMSGTEKDISKGDLAWLSTKPLKLAGNAKLLPKWIGPFEVMERLTGACRLRLLSTIRIHPVVNLLFLKGFIPSSEDDPQREMKQVIVKREDAECDVKEILGHRKKRKGVGWTAIKHYLSLHPHLLPPRWLSGVQPQGGNTVMDLERERTR